MRFEITLLLYVDPDANFLGSDRDFYSEDLEDHMRGAIYDIDDVILEEVSIKEI